MKVSTRFVAVFVFGLLIVPAIALAQWREPDQAPPQGNVPRPLNQGTQFIGEASSTSFVSGVYANQGANGAIVLKVEACPNGQTYVANGGKWSCGTAGGGNQNLLQVLTNGSDASTFTGSTYIGGAVGINVASTAALPSKLQVQGDTGSLAAIIGASQTGSGAIIGANLPSLKAGIYAAGAAGEWSGYFYGGNGVYIEQKLGIGTTAPTAQLDVRAAVGNRAAYLEGDVFINSKIQFPNKATTPNDGGNYILTTNQNADLMVMAQNNLYLVIDEESDITGGDLIVTKDDAGTPPLLVVKNNGNVGIGTTTPGAKLDVAGQVRITGGAPTTAGWVLTAVDSTGLARWQAPTGGGGSLSGTANQVAKFTSATTVGNSSITDTGTVVGIGTNNLLQVNVGTGDLAKIKNIAYSWPAAQGAANTVLTNNGSGTLTWAAAASTGPWTKVGTNIYLNPTTVNDKVGIGIAAPASPLHVYSATANANVVTISAPSNANHLAFRLSSEPSVNKWIEYLSGNDLRFWDSADRLTLRAGGNVGIGTSTPTRKLTVAGIINADGTRADSYDGVVISRNSLEKWFVGTDGNNTNVDFIIRRNQAVNDLTIQNSSGNVGIGVTSPESLLSVGKSVPSGRGGEISIANTAGPAIGNEAALNLSVGNTVSNNNYGGDAGDAQIKARSMASNNATDLIFSTYNGTSFGERMRIQSGGNVGIGVTNPTAQLTVARRLKVQNIGVGAGPTANLSLEAGAIDWNISAVNPTVSPDGFGGSLLFYTGTNNSVLAITPNSNVGIGNFADSNAISSKLTVNGDVSVAGEAATPAKISVDGGVRLNTTKARPACDATSRGMTWFTQGVAGVKDVYAVCAKDAVNTYAWRTLY